VGWLPTYSRWGVWVNTDRRAVHLLVNTEQVGETQAQHGERATADAETPAVG
jgi:hypothetical protein